MLLEFKCLTNKPKTDKELIAIFNFHSELFGVFGIGSKNPRIEEALAVNARNWLFWVKNVPEVSFNWASGGD